MVGYRKKILFGLLGAFLLAIIIALSLFSIEWVKNDDLADPTISDTPPSESETRDQNVELLGTANDGTPFAIIDGDLYSIAPDGSYVFVDHYYEKGYQEKNYAYADGALYRVDPPTGYRIQLARTFRDSFEAYHSIQELYLSPTELIAKFSEIGNTITVSDLPALWNSFTLQSDGAPEVADYNALRSRIDSGESDFLDNKILMNTEHACVGAQSVEFYATEPSLTTQFSKTSIHSEAVHFTEGDDVWFSGWYYIAEGMPLTIVDLESTFLRGSTGLRVLLKDGGQPFIQLKGFGDRDWSQEEGEPIMFPTGEWVNVGAHFTLSHTEGEIELWLNGEKVIDTIGQTLPVKDTIYDKLEIGITATNQETRLLVDDVILSHEQEPIAEALPESSCF